MFDSILNWAVVCIPAVLGIAGWLMPITNSTRKHRIVLAIGGVILSGLIYLQQYRSNAAHDKEVASLNKKLDNLQATVNGVKKDNERPINIGPINVPPPEKPKEPIQVLLDCNENAMPLILEPNIPLHLVFLDSGGGPGYSSLTNSGASPQNWGEEYVIRYVCRLVNYSTTALLSVEFPQTFIFRQGTKNGDAYTLSQSAPIIAQHTGAMKIPDIGPGKEWSVTYINPTDFWVEVDFQRSIKTANGDVAITIQKNAGELSERKMTIQPRMLRK